MNRHCSRPRDICATPNVLLQTSAARLHLCDATAWKDAVVALKRVSGQAAVQHGVADARLRRVVFELDVT